MRTSRSSRESGQALVESALTLPLLLFVVLGTLQLFLALQARSLAEYAAFRATRAGSLNNGDCNRMVHAAIAALVPSFTAFLSPATPGGSPGQKLANAFSLRAGNKYKPGPDGPNDGAVVWIAREQPLAAAIPQDEDREFDLPGYGGFRLEVRLIYWYPMSIPFANWVMARMFLAHWALTPYTALNPLMPAKYANWPGGGPTGTLNFDIGQELSTRVGKGQYVLPIDTNYSMRMMTPAKQKFFQKQHCDPTPQGLTP